MLTKIKSLIIALTNTRFNKKKRKVWRNTLNQNCFEKFYERDTIRNLEIY